MLNKMDVVKTYPLKPTSHGIQVDDVKVATIVKMLEVTKVDNRSVVDLYNVMHQILTGTNQTTMDHDGEVIALILGQLSTDERGQEYVQLEKMCKQFYQALITIEEDSFNIAQFFIGLSIFVQGSVEEKLTCAFASLTLNSHLISAVLVSKCFRALLVALEVFGNGNNEPDLGAAMECIDLCLKFLVADIFGEEENDWINTRDILHWYDQIGITSSPWIQLISFDNWKAGEIDVPRTQPAASNVILSFKLELEGDITIKITEQHAATMQAIIEEFPFVDYNAVDIYEEFEAVAKNEVVDEDSFITCIQTLFPDASMESNVFKKLLAIFQQFSRDSTGYVHHLELAAGLSLLARGSKSDKLVTAFQRFGLLNDSLSCYDLWRFLRSLMIVILSFSIDQVPISTPTTTIAMFVEKGAMDMLKQLTTSPATSAIATAAAAATATTATAALSPSSSSTLGTLPKRALTASASDCFFSFEEFGRWYNDGGFKNMSWLELLDLSKWKYVSNSFQIQLQYVHDGLATHGSKRATTTNAVPHFPATQLSFPSSTHSIPVLLEFRLSDASQDHILYFDALQVSLYSKFQAITSLSTYALSDLYHLLESFLVNDSCDGGLMDKNAYDACMNPIFQAMAAKSSNRPATEEMKLVHQFFHRFFYGYNRNGVGKISTLELFGGLSVLCESSKSEKLLFLFQLFDRNQDERMSRRELWRFFRSFLVMLFLLGNGQEKSVESLHVLCDDIAIHLVQRVFSDCGLKAMDDQLTFQALAQWYSEEGYQTSPWIELLDAKKWPPGDVDVVSQTKNVGHLHTRRHSSGSPSTTQANAALATTATATSALATSTTTSIHVHFNDAFTTFTNRMSPSPTRPVKEKSAEEAWIQLEFALLPLVDDSCRLRIRNQDIHLLTRWSDKLNFTHVSLVTFYEALQRHSSLRGLFVTRHDFFETIRSMIPKRSLTVDDQEFLSYHLIRLYTLYERLPQSHSDHVNMRHLVAGFSVLFQGSKTDKLAALFTFFNAKHDGFLFRRQLYELLNALLLFLFAFSSTPEQGMFRANQAASFVTSKVFADSSIQNEDVIEFNELAAWYSNGGYQLASWLELMDFRKWPQDLQNAHVNAMACPQSISLPVSPALKASKQEDSPWLLLSLDPSRTQSLSCQSNASSPASTFLAKDENAFLTFTDADVKTYLSLLKRTEMDLIDIKDIHETLSRFASRVEGLSRGEYMNAIGTLITHEHWVEDEKRGVLAFFHRLFDMFLPLNLPESSSVDVNDATTLLKREDRISVDELACGLSILGKGSKSEKLSACFAWMAKAEAKKSPRSSTPAPTTLSMEGLKRYLGSFLLTLASLSSTSVDWHKKSSVAFVKEQVLDIVHVIIDQFQREAKLAHSLNRVGFEQFGQWYNTGGYEILSWIELLDVSKWQPPTMSQVGARRSDLDV